MRVKGGPIILATSLSLTLLIFEGILPICLKHGRTIGMRFFGVGYVTEDGIETNSDGVFYYVKSVTLSSIF